MKKILKFTIFTLISLTFCGCLYTKTSFVLAYFPAQQTDTVPSRNYTVVIDPGHGGTDPGSIGYKTKVKESDLNLNLSLLLKEKL